MTEPKRTYEMFRLAVEAAPAAMILVDAAGTIVMSNAVAEQVLGYSRDEIVGQPVDRFVPASARGRHAGHRAMFLSAPHPRPMGAGRDLHALRKDGTEVPVEIGLSPIETADGFFVLAAVTDITERKRVEYVRAQLLLREQAAREELERASHMKDQFLAVLSHELRTPLNAILGYTHLLRTGGMAAGDAPRALEVIERNAQAQMRLVEGLLDVSRIIAGKLELHLERLELREVVDAALDVVRPDAEAKGITLDVPPPPQTMTVLGDRGRLQQVLWNLLANAVKFTPNGGTISVASHPRDARAEITISDTGCGISAEFLPRVFDRFKQEARRNESSRGLGLGLALVRELVEAHGGTVIADSAGEGQGSRFTVTLPLMAATATRGPAGSKPDNAAAADPCSAAESSHEFVTHTPTPD